jgi:hypothetical protein
MTDAAPEMPPIVEAAEAVAQTIASPTLPVVIDDLILVHKLANEVKAQLQVKHPSLCQIFSMLFHLN